MILNVFMCIHQCLMYIVDTGVRCQLLQDHILVPGASWSQLKQGDEVVLIGRLSNGWYRCLAQRAVTAHTMHGIDSVSITSHLSEISGDSGLPSSNRQ